jgi:hypothetical protein
MIPPPTDTDYEQAETFIKSIIGPDFKIAKNDSDGKIITDRCNQVWQETFKWNANKTYINIHWGLKNVKDYARIVDPIRLAEDLNQINLCVGEVTEPFLKVMKSINSLKKSQGHLSPQNSNEESDTEHKGATAGLKSVLPQKDFKPRPNSSKFTFSQIAK